MAKDLDLIVPKYLLMQLMEASESEHKEHDLRKKAEDDLEKVKKEHLQA